MIEDIELKPSSRQQEQSTSVNSIMGGITGRRRSIERKILSERFTIIKRLGRGTFGTVQLAADKESGENVAIKTIKKCKLETDRSLERKRREMHIMASLHHPNIIRIHEVLENREKFVMIMEFAPRGELFDYLCKKIVLDDDEARRIFRQVSAAVYYCHKNNICHRDLKLENILLDQHVNAKITDFGFSRFFDSQQLITTYCGSELYASPEIINKVPYVGSVVDCWSLGVLLFTLVYGHMPFFETDRRVLYTKISVAKYLEPEILSTASPFIREMLTVCPQRRATIEQICNHRWMNIGYTTSCLDVAKEQSNESPVGLHPSSLESSQILGENSGSQIALEGDESVQHKAKVLGADADKRSVESLTSLLNLSKLVSKTKNGAGSESSIKKSQEELENGNGRCSSAASKPERKSVRFQSETNLAKSKSNPLPRRYPSVLCCISGVRNNDHEPSSAPVAYEPRTKSPDNIIKKSCLKSATLPKSSESILREQGSKYATLPREKDYKNGN